MSLERIDIIMECNQRYMDAISRRLTLYCIYYNTSDFPNKYVVRRWYGVEPDEETHAIVDSLDDARKAIPKGFRLLERQVDDDPVIVETWI